MCRNGNQLGPVYNLVTSLQVPEYNAVVDIPVCMSTAQYVNQHLLNFHNFK